MEKKEQQLYAFLKGEGKDINGRTFESVMGFNNLKMEIIHNYIQSLFPTDEPSAYHKSVVLTPELIETMKNDSVVLGNLQRAFNKMMDFYGFIPDDKGNIRLVSPNLKKALKTWLKPNNHNFLRITRILRCMHLFEMKEEENKLYRELKRLSQIYDFLYIPMEHWNKATEK